MAALKWGSAEPGRRGEDDIVDVGNRQGFLVGIKAAEALVFRNPKSSPCRVLPVFREDVPRQRRTLASTPAALPASRKFTPAPPPRSAKADDHRVNGCLFWPRRTDGKLATAAAEAAMRVELLMN